MNTCKSSKNADWSKANLVFDVEIGGRGKQREIKLPAGLLQYMTSEYPQDTDENGMFRMIGTRKPMASESDRASVAFVPESTYNKFIDDIKKPELRKVVSSRSADAEVDNNEKLHIKMERNETTLKPDDIATGQQAYMYVGEYGVEFFPHTQEGLELAKVACGLLIKL